MITYLLPTRDRLPTLQRTMKALAALDADAHEACGGAEVIVVDNASSVQVRLPAQLDNGFAVRVIRRDANEGAAARNPGVEAANGEWIIMLDDDSHPLDCGHVDVIADADHRTGAIGAEILLTNGRHEAGGLPEVFIGCGVAIRRDAFLSVGGYDPAFDYYAEEYDLCAKLLLQGWRIEHDCRFRVRHEKVVGGRDMNRILHRLVRNNCWVMQRYAPKEFRASQINQTIQRYAEIAVAERAADGYAIGVSETLESLNAQPVRTMSRELFDRFTGAATISSNLRNHALLDVGTRVAIVAPGKNVSIIRELILKYGVQIVDLQLAEVLVIGTLSPGPIIDAIEEFKPQKRPVVAPWVPFTPRRQAATCSQLVGAQELCNNR